jgi:hypothetical protein
VFYLPKGSPHSVALVLKTSDAKQLLINLDGCPPVLMNGEIRKISTIADRFLYRARLRMHHQHTKRTGKTLSQRAIAYYFDAGKLRGLLQRSQNCFWGLVHHIVTWGITLFTEFSEYCVLLKGKMKKCAGVLIEQFAYTQSREKYENEKRSLL